MRKPVTSLRARPNPSHEGRPPTVPDRTCDRQTIDRTS